MYFEALKIMIRFNEGGMQGRKKTRVEIKRDSFQHIIAAAKNEDLVALKQLFAPEDLCSDNDYPGDLVLDCMSRPIIKLAQQGNINAVNFLVSIRSKLRHDALEGFARGNHIELVNQYIEDGAHLNRAVFGAACEGHQPLVDDLLARNGAVKSAIVGYARGGFEAQVNDLLKIHPKFIQLAVYGYAHGLQFKPLERLLAKDVNMLDAIRGFSENGYISNKSKFLYLLTMVENEKLLTELMRAASYKYLRHFEPKGMLQESDKLKFLMKQHKLTYFQALAWRTPQFRMWILYSVVFIQARRLPLDMVLYIAASIPANKLSMNDTRDLRVKLDIHLYKSFVITSLNACTVEEKRAKSLAIACEQVKTKHDLHTLIRYQKELFEKTRYVMPNRHRPAHEQPFEDHTTNAFTAIVDRYVLKLK